MRNTKKIRWRCVTMNICSLIKPVTQHNVVWSLAKRGQNWGLKEQSQVIYTVYDTRYCILLQTNKTDIKVFVVGFKKPQWWWPLTNGVNNIFCQFLWPKCFVQTLQGPDILFNIIIQCLFSTLVAGQIWTASYWLRITVLLYTVQRRCWANFNCCSPLV